MDNAKNTSALFIVTKSHGNIEKREETLLLKSTINEVHDMQSQNSNSSNLLEYTIV